MNYEPLICRSCLKTDTEMISLFSEIIDMDNLTISDCFNICTDIKIENDELFPQTICGQCLGELRIAYTFRAKCEKSDYLLRNQILKTEFKYEEGDSYGQDMIVEVIQDDVIGTDENGDGRAESQQVKRQTIGRKWILQNVETIDHAELKGETQIVNVESVFNEVIQDESKSEIEIESDHDSHVIEESEEEVLLTIGSNVDEKVDETEALILNKNTDNAEQIEHIKPEIQLYTKKSTAASSEDALKNWFECDRCKKGFKLKSTLEKHIEIAHNGKTLHLCNICGKMCSQESSLKSHMLQHIGERPYKCNSCSKSYFTKNGLASHQIVHKDKKPDTKFLCSVCGKGFTTNQRLRIHTYTHTGERNYACDLCDKTFATEFRLRSHRRIHTGERPYKCQECGLTFAQGNALKCHKRVHTGEKPYVCKFCGKRFSQNTILKTHMTLHTGKTVKCPDCDKKFSRASYLILHRREHTGEKPYVCELCPNRYKQKSHLDRHMDTHLGVKHKCEICSKEYSKQWSLKMHMFTHQDEKPFSCAECSVSFIRKDKYKTHLKTHHGQTLVDNKPVLLVVEEPSQYVQIEEICSTTDSTNVRSVISTMPGLE